MFNDWHAVMALGLAGHTPAEPGDPGRQPGAVGRDQPGRRRTGRLRPPRGVRRLRHRTLRPGLELLVGLAPAAQVVGGSHAQRDVLNLTVIAAAARSGDTRLAAGLAADRVAAKPAAAGATRRLLEANGAPG